MTKGLLVAMTKTGLSVLVTIKGLSVIVTKGLESIGNNNNYYYFSITNIMFRVPYTLFLITVKLTVGRNHIYIYGLYD